MAVGKVASLSCQRPSLVTARRLYFRKIRLDQSPTCFRSASCFGHFQPVESSSTRYFTAVDVVANKCLYASSVSNGVFTASPSSSSEGVRNILIPRLTRRFPYARVSSRTVLSMFWHCTALCVELQARSQAASCVATVPLQVGDLRDQAIVYESDAVLPAPCGDVSRQALASVVLRHHCIRTKHAD